MTLKEIKCLRHTLQQFRRTDTLLGFGGDWYASTIKKHVHVHVSSRCSQINLKTKQSTANAKKQISNTVPVTTTKPKEGFTDLKQKRTDPYKTKLTTMSTSINFNKNASFASVDVEAEEKDNTLYTHDSDVETGESASLEDAAKRTKAFIILIASVAALGGLIFGYVLLQLFPSY